MKTVLAIRASGKINNGCTKPYYVTCDEDIYIVKFKENPQGLRVLINEYVCAEIGTIIGLPLPSPALIRVSEDFVRHNNQELSIHIGAEITPGIHFGTKKVKKAYPITNSDMLKFAKNNDIIPDIILFDQLVCNRDRDSNGGNLLFDATKKEIVVIDHTHVFDLGSIWTNTDLDQRIDQEFTAFDASGYVYRKFVPFIRGNNPFYASLQRMARLKESDLWNIINGIPIEWGVTIQEKESLMRYIFDRLTRIEECLPILKPDFPFWKGGM